MRSWLESKRRFGTGYANVAGTSGRPKAKGSLHGAQSAKARTGTDRVKQKREGLHSCVVNAETKRSRAVLVLRRQRPDQRAYMVGLVEEGYFTYFRACTDS